MYGFTAMLSAAYKGCLLVVQWLLSEGGSSIAETTYAGSDVWELLNWPTNSAFYDDGLAPSPLCKVMLLLGDPLR